VALDNRHHGRQWDIHREWANDNLDPDSEPTLDEVIGVDPGEPERFDQELAA
jgi:hypothetical protein